ncbi:MAG: cytochrome c [bacterium]
MKTKTASFIAAAALLGTVQLSLADDAAANWGKYCASCHAKDGSGKTMMGQKSGVGDYTTAAAQSKFTDAEAIQAITAGKGKMKSFSDRLTPEEIKALVAYVRGLKK